LVTRSLTRLAALRLHGIVCMRPRTDALGPRPGPCRISPVCDGFIAVVQDIGSIPCRAPARRGDGIAPAGGTKGVVVGSTSGRPHPLRLWS
jgi:hypothetical protein